jgi:hypothetical protein
MFKFRQYTTFLVSTFFCKSWWWLKNVSKIHIHTEPPLAKVYYLHPIQIAELQYKFKWSPTGTLVGPGKSASIMHHHCVITTKGRTKF